MCEKRRKTKGRSLGEKKIIRKVNIDNNKNEKVEGRKGE